MDKKWLVVGAGFAGATFARLVAEYLDQKVLVIDKRNHIAGNAFDAPDEKGILTHKYGPHIFHTNSKKVWDFLNRFSGWDEYEHTVLGQIDGQLVHIPFNLNSIKQCYTEAQAKEYEELLIAEYGYGETVPILTLRKHENPKLAELAEFVFNKVFLNYTKKQWGRSPEELSAAVTSRVPVAISHDNRYFRDEFQAMPKHGYTPMFDAMLDHPNIEVQLGVDFHEIKDQYAHARIVYTGPLDEYFGCSQGHLPYRSLRFETKHFDEEYCQPVAVVNFPNDHAYTRSTEMKRLTGQKTQTTSLMYEYPQEYVPGENDAYYPIPAEESREVYEKYKALLDEQGDGVIFIGRLADYKYYNMDQVVARAIAIFERDVYNKEIAF